MSSLQQNFDEQLISQKIAVVQLPQFYTSRSRSSSHSPGHPPLTQRPAIDLQKLLYGNPKKAAPVTERLHQLQKQQKHRETRLRQKQTEQQQEQLKQCTFRPRINENVSQRRTLREFLESQQKFKDRVREKNDRMRVRLQGDRKEETFKPDIGRNAGAVTDRNNNKQDIFERLYRQKPNKENQIMAYSSNAFAPVITAKGKKIIRDMPVTQYLYEDAKRRQQLKMKATQQPVEIEQKQPNLTNQKYAAQKFIKEYYTVLSDLGLTEGMEPLPFQQFQDILEKMGFLTIVSIETKSQQWLLANEAFEFLKQTSPNIRNLCVFLMGLVGIYHVNPINFDSSKLQNPAPELNLGAPQGRKLQKHYQLLYRNRLFAQSLHKTSLTEQYSFKPQINPASQQLAQTFRSKMLQQTTLMLETHEISAELPKDGVITHVELLQLNRLGKEAELRRRREEKEIQSLKECTFKPAIDNMKKSNISTESYFNTTSKFEELYNLSKTMRRVEKTKAELDFQKSGKECTFVPKINKKMGNTVKAEIYAKDIDKTIVRMILSRKQRQAKVNALCGNHSEKRQSKSKTHKTEKTIVNTFTDSKENNPINTQPNLKPVKTEPPAPTITDPALPRDDQEIPFLVIDVNLGQEVQQIIVYKDQADKPQILAQDFSKKHGLDEQSKAKLIQLLRIEINSILQKIDEQQDQQSEA